VLIAYGENAIGDTCALEPLVALSPKAVSSRFDKNDKPRVAKPVHVHSGIAFLIFGKSYFVGAGNRLCHLCPKRFGPMSQL